MYLHHSVVFQVHQFERDLEKLRTRHKTEMDQKLKQMTADERRLLKHIKDKHDNDMKMFLSDQKAAYKAAKNQFKKVRFVFVHAHTLYFTCNYNKESLTLSLPESNFESLNVVLHVTLSLWMKP